MSAIAIEAPAPPAEDVLRSLVESHDPGGEGRWISTRRLIEQAAPRGVQSTEVFRWLRVAARHGLLLRRINGRDAVWEWRLPEAAGDAPASSGRRRARACDRAARVGSR